jgi:predicted ATPase/DNA-binding winged helix-turn-helix (wHTH) protein
MHASVHSRDRRPIQFRVLGPVAATSNGQPLQLGGRRQRALLALLLIDAGRPVAADRLAEELWGGAPPAGWDVTLRTYVSRLRRALEDAGAIAGVGGGYAIDADPDSLDASRFERLVREGQDALGRGAAAPAAVRLSEALELWRGPPFGELAEGGRLRVEAERLEELRLHAVELRIEADLQLGRAGELVDELEALVAEHPYRERLWRHLMLALYRAGRQTDALAAYQRARTGLDEELGLEPGQELRDLELAVLRHEVPTPRPAGDRHNLPEPVTTFVGRSSELAELPALLLESRLVTLTGVGGVGKTRLALEVARAAVVEFPGGVFFVDLAPLTDADGIASQVAAALDSHEQAGIPVIEQLATSVRDADTLMLLDNCEHLSDAVAAFVGGLLSAAPRLHVLATSRVPLGVPGEVDVAVPPLSLPDEPDDPAEILRSEAVTLFLARARAARRTLGDDTSSLVTAARICADLDGLPLALELAAARAKALSLTDIAAGLSDRFRFLVSWRRLAPARHRTLRQAIDWSYELLTPPERTLLAGLAIFAGSFTLEAAADVCLEGDRNAARDLIHGLVEASLVTIQEGDADARYRLLETVRQYAAERQNAAGEAAELGRRHADHYARLAERMWAPVRDAAVLGTEWLDHLTADRANLAAALAWARDNDDPVLSLRIAEALWYSWWIHGELSAGRAWLDPAIEAAADADPRLVALARCGAAGLAWAQGDLGTAWDQAALARATFAQLDDPTFQASATNTMAVVALMQDRNAEAERLLEEAIGLYARPTVIPRVRDINTAVALLNLGEVALGRDDIATAVERYLAARELYRRQDDQHGVALTELNLGAAAVQQGRLDEARGLLARALRSQREIGFLQHAAACMESIAALANAAGEPVIAAQLLGGTARIREQTGNPALAWNARLCDRETAAARAALGDEAADMAFEQGRRLSSDETMGLALTYLG